MADPLRIANCSGFFGDRLAAAREMVEGGPIDVLTGDWLAELTMLILWKGYRKDPSKGWASTFLLQMEEVLGRCVEEGIKVVTNAGGLNPAGLADAVRALAERLGVDAAVAHVEGDDLLPRLDALTDDGHELFHLDTGKPLAEARGSVVSANAYLGGWPIAEALAGGADVVVCPRVTDASLVVGPAAWHHGWGQTDWDALAGAVAAGHVVECGAQATGGNYAFFREVPGLEHPGFPIAEVAEDGSAVITKHPGTGGEVSVGTVTAQLLYEIAGPDYPNTDVVARFDTLHLEAVGPDRVRISGARGRPAPPDLKVSVNLLGGWRNSMTFVLTGLDIEEKAELTVRSLAGALGGTEQFETFDAQVIRRDRPDAPTEAQATAELRVTVKDHDPEKVGRRFSNAATELALAGYPGLHLTGPPTGASDFGVFWPTLVPAHLVVPTVVLPDGRRVEVPHRANQPAGPGRPTVVDPSDDSLAPWSAEEGAVEDTSTALSGATAEGARGVSSAGAGDTGAGDTGAGDTGAGDTDAGAPTAATRRLPLGTLVGARSGDKGGNANVGLWARSDDSWRWLDAYLTLDRFRELLPEAADLPVERFRLPNLRALNFVVVGLLGEGVAASTRPDPQAKGLGEYVRSRMVDIPVALIPGS